MSVFRLEALRARHGDALLLHVGTEAVPKLIMIDGGAAQVYDSALKPRLKELRGSATKPLSIRLLMVSHIDDDHINGVLDLFTDLVEADEEREQPLAKIDRMWHNSFPDVVAAVQTGDQLQESAVELASAARTDPHAAGLFQRHTRLVLESVRQGRRLRRDARRLNIPINTGFADGLVLHDTAPARPISIGGITLRVLGPGRKEVDDLKQRWRKDVKKILDKKAKRELALQSAADLDKSVFNLSSIVVLATREAQPHQRMLLTGDARGDLMLEWMEAAKVIPPGGKLHVDLLKLPHHGSDRNLSLEFFQRITADHYVVSGDGRHGNPEPETFDWLFEARAGEVFTIHMTYSPRELKEASEYEHVKLRKVLDRHPGSRARLRFPGNGERSISVAL